MYLGFTSPPVVPLYPQEDKYASLNKLDNSKKVEALKDPRLQPSKIEDGYDSVAHAMWLWTQVGAKAKAAGNVSFTEQKQIAQNFYEHVLGPAQIKAGMEPMSPELWHQKAYNEALDYKIEDAYGNSWLGAIRNGWNNALVTAAKDTSPMVSLVGGALDNVVAQYRKERAWRQQSDITTDLELRSGPGVDIDAAAAIRGDNSHSYANWIQRVKQIDSQLAAKKADRENSDFQRLAIANETGHQFWAEALPTHGGALNKVTSWAVEQVGSVPVFAAIDAATAGLGTIPEALGFTGKLAASPAGRRVLGYLTAGATGTAYGALTKPQDNPAQHLRDGLDFMVLHGVFDVGGVGLRKLIDMLPSGSKALEAMKRRQDAVMLSWEKNQRAATPAEKYEAHVGQAANTIRATGLAGERSFQVAALHHLTETAKMSKEELAKYEESLLNKDAALHAPMLARAHFIQDLLGDKKITEVTEGSPEEKMITERLEKLALDGAGKMNTAVDMKAEFEAKAESNLKKPSAKNTLEYYINKVHQDLAKDPGAAALVSPEQVQKAAQKMYEKDLQAAARVAEKETGTPKIVQAQDIGKRIKPNKAAMTLKTRTANTASGRSVSVSPSFNVYMKAARRAAIDNGKSLTEFFSGLDEKQFSDDLQEHFYPKALAKAKIWFEKGSGGSNPNFLAFMRNYAGQMPKEFAAALDEHLIDTVKVQKGMNGRRLTEPQLAYYAKSMYNHVDNFLGSGRWPEETNIFRSTQEDMWNSTEWQRDLITERIAQEQRMLRNAFSGNPKELRVALATHAKFSGFRLDAFNLGADDLTSPDAYKHFNDKIATQLTDTGEYKRWNF
jgi:hypothetical protein